MKGPLKGCHTSGICLAPAGSDGVARRLGASGVGRRDGVWFNASALHVRDQLVGDLCKDVLSQSRHAQHVVSRAIHVVPEWDKLLWQRKTWESEERLSLLLKSSGPHPGPSSTLHVLTHFMTAHSRRTLNWTFIFRSNLCNMSYICFSVLPEINIIQNKN